jgi:hypothetical protein
MSEARCRLRTLSTLDNRTEGSASRMATIAEVLSSHGPKRQDASILTARQRFKPRRVAEHHLTTVDTELHYRLDRTLTGVESPAWFRTGHYRRINGH